MQNLKVAFRALLKSPFITLVAVLSLAVGIGANAAIYSLFEQALLRPLPVPEPERLVNLSSPGPKSGSITCGQAGNCDEVFSYPMFRDLEATPTGLSGLAAHLIFGANIAYDGTTLGGEGTLVSGSYFEVLGLRPALGRLIGPADDREIGSHPVAVLSHGFWQSHLGADPGVLGRTIVVNGHPMTIIGVGPEGFTGTTFAALPRVFVPITMRGVVNPGFNGFDSRRTYWAYLFGRLQPGVTREQAERALTAAYSAIVEEVEVPLQRDMSQQTLAQFGARGIVLREGTRGQSSVHEDVRTPMTLMFVTAMIVLLIACANIANLLLARGTQRAMDVAVRMSLGAGRARVIRHVLTESVLLALLGGVASLLVARVTLAGVDRLLPPEASVHFDYRIDGPVVAFAMAIALGAGLLTGLLPALHGTKSDVLATLRASASHLIGGRGATLARSVLVTAQIALSMALLVAGGLFLRSLVNINRTQLGLEPENLLTFTVSPELNGYPPERVFEMVDRIRAEMAAVPGVGSVSASSVPVLASSNWGSIVFVEGRSQDPDAGIHVDLNAVGAHYFTTLGVPLLRGREFTENDRRDSGRVAMVNESFARRFGLGEDAVGKRIGTAPGELDMEIVGVVRDAKLRDIKEPETPLFFVPYHQQIRPGAAHFYVRTTVDPRDVMPRVQGVIASIDPNLPVQGLKSMSRQVRENFFLDRIVAIFSAAFGAIATLLAAVGLYGVLAYSVAQRTREIGVRMALGADPARVRSLIFGQTAVMLGVGGSLGILAALGLGWAASSLLFGVPSYDLTVISAALLLLGAVALAATSIPALRASRLEPIRALRAG